MGVSAGGRADAAGGRAGATGGRGQVPRGARARPQRGGLRLAALHPALIISRCLECVNAEGGPMGPCVCLPLCLALCTPSVGLLLHFLPSGLPADPAHPPPACLKQRVWMKGVASLASDLVFTTLFHEMSRGKAATTEMQSRRTKAGHLPETSFVYLALTLNLSLTAPSLHLHRHSPVACCSQPASRRAPFSGPSEHEPVSACGG